MSRVYFISFPLKEIKSSQPQLLDMSRHLEVKVTSPGAKLATRVEIGVSGDSGMVSVAKNDRDTYSLLRESLIHTFIAFKFNFIF